MVKSTYLSPWGKTQRNIPKKARDLTNQICEGVSVYSACDWLWEKVVSQKKEKKKNEFCRITKHPQNWRLAHQPQFAT